LAIFESVNDKDTTRITVIDEMTIYTASTDHSELASLLDFSKNTVIDLSSVSEVDTAGMQILLAIIKEYANKQTELQFEAISTCLLEYITFFNLKDKFGV